jgi:hypothetical protein
VCKHVYRTAVHHSILQTHLVALYLCKALALFLAVYAYHAACMLPVLHASLPIPELHRIRVYCGLAGLEQN